MKTILKELSKSLAGWLIIITSPIWITIKVGRVVYQKFVTDKGELF